MYEWPMYTFVASGILSLNIFGCAFVLHLVTMPWLPSEGVSARAFTHLMTRTMCMYLCFPFPILKHFSELCQLISPKLLCRLLKEFMDITNATRMRKDRNKIGPSGMSRNEAYSAPGSWGRQNYLILVDINLIHELKEAVGGADLIAFVSEEFEQWAEIAFKTLGVKELTPENIWIVFRNMLPLLFI